MPFQKGHKFAKGGARKNAGRPALSARELAGEYREEAVKRLAYWMRSDNAKASAAAASYLLNRSDGMAPQSVELSGKLQIETPEEEQARAERVVRYLAKIGGAKI